MHNSTENGLDIVWLVNAATASILDATIVEVSQDGRLWVRSSFCGVINFDSSSTPHYWQNSVAHSSLTCLPATLLPLPRDFFIHIPFMLTPLDASTEPRVATPPNHKATSNLTIPDASVLECSISMKTRKVLRHVRVRLVRDKQKEWVIYEMWFRNWMITSFLIGVSKLSHAIFYILQSRSIHRRIGIAPATYEVLICVYITTENQRLLSCLLGQHMH